LKRLRTEVGHLEQAVAELEAKQSELTAELEAPETYSQPGKAQHLNRELSTIVDQIDSVLGNCGENLLDKRHFLARECLPLPSAEIQFS
jgi:hypothetical protein